LNFLLDTNVVSEWVRPHPNENVVRWLAEVDEDRTYVSVVTFAEIRMGVDAMAPGRRRELLRTWLEADLRARFEGRILGVDPELALAWGALMARGARAGVTVSAMDALIAASAETHGFVLVTRDTRHLDKLEIKYFNPWAHEPPRAGDSTGDIHHE